MRDVLLLAAGLGLSYVGFALLALSLDRNWRKITGAASPARWASRRAAGYALLALALVPLLVRDGPSFGAILWVLGLAAAAFAVAFTLTWQTSWLRPLARLLGAR